MHNFCLRCGKQIETGALCDACLALRIVDYLRTVGGWLTKSEYGDEPGWRVCPACKRTQKEGHAEYCEWQRAKNALDEALKVAEKIAGEQKTQ